MSITPLDLQTLFVKMSQVGKDQALIQKSVENQQNREAEHLIKKEKSRDHSVNKAEEDKETQRIKDKNNGNGESLSEDNKQDDSEDQTEEKPKYFTDPKLGHNIDISG